MRKYGFKIFTTNLQISQSCICSTKNSFNAFEFIASFTEVNIFDPIRENNPPTIPNFIELQFYSNVFCASLSVSAKIFVNDFIRLFTVSRHF